MISRLFSFWLKSFQTLICAGGPITEKSQSILSKWSSFSNTRAFRAHDISFIYIPTESFQTLICAGGPITVVTAAEAAQNQAATPTATTGPGWWLVCWFVACRVWGEDGARLSACVLIAACKKCKAFPTWIIWNDCSLDSAPWSFQLEKSQSILSKWSSLSNTRAFRAHDVSLIFILTEIISNAHLCRRSYYRKIAINLKQMI